MHHPEHLLQELEPLERRDGHLGAHALGKPLAERLEALSQQLIRPPPHQLHEQEDVAPPVKGAVKVDDVGAVGLRHE